MRLLDLLRSVSGAFSHRVRASLTVLGVVIGTASIVLLASLLHGGRNALIVTSQGPSDDAIIRIDTDDPPEAQREKTTRALGRADADALARDATMAGAHVEAESSFDAWARLEGRRKEVAVVSTGPTTMALYRLTMEGGRALDESDNADGRRVCVIGHEVFEQLLESKPLGARQMRLEISGELFSVVGVLREKPMIGSTTSTHRWDRKVLIPRTTYDTLYAPAHDVNRIFVRPLGLTSSSRAPARRNIQRVLLAKHLGVANFSLEREENSGKERLVIDVIEMLLLATGVLAVFASGINIMNVMLVTVSERTREIGLRRALGATQRSILVQFLLEAAALSLVGALVGILAGCLLAWSTSLLARSALGEWDFALPAWSMFLGLALAVFTGLGFGLLPAWRASRTLPIDALRSE